MANYPSPRHSTGPSPSPSNGHGYFDKNTYQQRTQNKEVVRYIRRDLIPTDQQIGYVYVVKQADTAFCKVGYAHKDAEERIKAIGKCQIVTDSSYRIGGFVGAYRAERLVHCLLSHCRHHRKECPCGCENREWYKIDFEEAIRQVQIVYAWLRREPYELTTVEKKLKPVWEEALNKWLATQETQTPLGWNEFFITGPSMDVVISGLWYDSSPQPSPSRQQSTRRYVNRLVINIIRRSRLKAIRTGMQQAKSHLTYHGQPSDSASTASKVRPPHRDEQSSPEIPEDWETADEELDLTPSKPPQSRLLRTRDHSSTAQDTQTAVVAGSESTAQSKKTAIIELINVSPSNGSQNSASNTWHAASANECQQTPSLPTIQHENNDNPVQGSNRAGGATYYNQATVGRSDIGTPSSKEEGLEQRGNFCSRGERGIVDNTEVWAYMPGAFPEDEIEKASLIELECNEVPELLDLLKELDITQNIYKDKQCSHGDPTRMGDLPVDSNLVISVSDDIFPVTDQLVSEATSLVSEQLPSVPIPVSTSTSHGALSTHDRSQSSTTKSLSVYGSVPGHTEISAPSTNCQLQHEANIGPFQASSSRNGGIRLLPIGLTGDVATQCKVTVGSKPSVVGESARSETDHDSSVITDFKGSVKANSSPSGDLGPGGTLGIHPVSPSEGTTVTHTSPRTETTEDAPHYAQSNAVNHGICFMQPYQMYSFEELRLADYNAGHLFEVEENVEYEEDASEWETQSSLSDDDRPRAKQRELARELWELCVENNQYGYGLDCGRAEYESGWERLERLRRDLEAMGMQSTEHNRPQRLRRDLKAMDVQSTEHTQLQMWKDWPEQPSEDDPEDTSWCATGTERQETAKANDKGVKQHESNAEEVEKGVIRENSLPKPQHEPDPALTPHSNGATPAFTPSTAQTTPTNVPRVSEFNFRSDTSQVDVPGFNFTRHFGSSTIAPPAKKALVSTTKLFGDVDIDTTLKATRRKRKAIPTVRPIPKASLGGENANNLSEGMLAGEDDDERRIQSPIVHQKCQKGADSAIATAERATLAEQTITAEGPTEKMNQHQSCSQSQQNSPRMNNTIVRSADGPPVLAIENKEHWGNGEEEAKSPASESLWTNRHIRSPSCAWGADC